MPTVYREHTVPADLAPRVAAIWTLRGAPAGAEEVHRILPDGCIDLIFHLGDVPSGSSARDPRPRAVVVGAMRHASRVSVGGSMDTLGVRFRPGGAAAFLRLPAREVTDASVPLDAVWAESRTLEDALGETSGAARMTFLAEALRRRQREETAVVPPPLARACEVVERTWGRTTVRELAAEVGIGVRQLERLFAVGVGLSPKEACRVARFRHALRLLHEGPGLAWTRLAFACGYHDQAHFIREFRSMAGVTPSAYRRERMDVASVQYAGAAAP
jgi:AraC-like DNA-binding protein